MKVWNPSSRSAAAVGRGIGVVAPELIRAASHQHDCTQLYAVTDGDSSNIGAEVIVVEIASHVLRKFCLGGDIVFLPEIESNTKLMHGCNIITRKFRNNQKP